MGNKKKRNKKNTPEVETIEKEDIVPLSEISFWRKLLWWIVGTPKEYRKGPVRDTVEMIIQVVIIVFVVRVVAIEAYKIPTGSMEKTLLIGDYLLVNKFVYGVRTPDWIGIPFTQIGLKVPHVRFPSIKDPKQGDIIVFRYPLNTRINYIKRCVAVGGQTLVIKDKKLFVDDVEFELPPNGQFTDSYIIPENVNMRHIFPRGKGNKDNYGPIKVPEGHYFMMGDNRDNSADSRYWGFLPEDLVLGKAAIIYFSWEKRGPIYKIWKKIRWGRLFNLIK